MTKYNLNFSNYCEEVFNKFEVLVLKNEGDRCLVIPVYFPF